jgi:hypothetical protein
MRKIVVESTEVSAGTAVGMARRVTAESRLQREFFMARSCAEIKIMEFNSGKPE